MKHLPVGVWLLVALLVVSGAVVLAMSLLNDDEPDLAFSLARPPAGQVRADYLADGTPVWVIGHEDGSVDVLSGFDTHVPFNLGKMLWWCPRARGLDNPHHGSKWDEYGAKLGGPAPAGLPSWEVGVRSSRVFLGSQRPAPPLDTRVDGPPEQEREWCLVPQGGVVFHTFDGWRVWDSPTAAVEAAPEDWILLEGELVGVAAENRVRLCAVGDCEDSVVAANVELPPPNLEFGPLGGGRFIAHVRDGVLVDVASVVSLEGPAP